MDAQSAPTCQKVPFGACSCLVARFSADGATAGFSRFALPFGGRSAEFERRARHKRKEWSRLGFRRAGAIRFLNPDGMS